MPAPPLEKIVLFGLARNCGHCVESEVTRLLQIFGRLGTVSAFVIESDSSDDTSAALERLSAQDSRVRYASLGVLSERLPDRPERIAHCRNRCLDELACRADYDSADYVVIADLDGVNTMLSDAAVESCWARSDWDVCTANQLGPYYDVWALRHPLWSPNDCWQLSRFLKEHGVPPAAAVDAAVHSRMMAIDPGAEWIETDSSFGGLAIYRREALGEARYSCKDTNGRFICEHVPFHADLRARGKRIFVNPKLLNGRVGQHSLQQGLGKRWKILLAESLAALRAEARFLIMRSREKRRRQ